MESPPSPQGLRRVLREAGLPAIAPQERRREFKAVSLRTEIAYKADALGKVAQRTEAQGSGVEVNAKVAQLQFAFLSGEAPQAQAARGFSRGHSTAQVRAETDRREEAAFPCGNEAKRSGKA